MSGGEVTRRPSRPIFEGLNLEKIDLSSSKIGDSLWVDVHLQNVRFANGDLRNATLSSGTLKTVSFAGSNLQGTHFGGRGVAGPLVADCDFSHAKLAPSTYSRQLFRDCRFSYAKLNGVNFRGARFEYCVFEGLLRNIQFQGRLADPNPAVATLENEMKGVDFSRADLHWVEFTDGIDLRTCTFPPEGYLRISDPKKAFKQAMGLIEGRRTDESAKKAVWFLEQVEKKFPEDQPLAVIRRSDLMDASADEVTREMNKLALWALERVAVSR